MLANHHYSDMYLQMLESEFNFNQGLIIANFSEAGIIVLTDFALQNTRQLDNTINESNFLACGQVLSSDVPIIVVHLSDFDLKLN